MSVNSINIIIFDYTEKVITWLDPDLAEIKETNTKNACRRVEITYPYDSTQITEEDVLWYEQGNKIYIPSINGITSCLYVINTEYQIDFWKENTITVTAEEVLTELNYDVISFETAEPIPITEEQLDTWFGSFYDVNGLDELRVNHNTVSPEGVMTYMSLLRMIEEQTERVFVTEYNNEGGRITRSLALLNLDNYHAISDTATLDLNYNLESLEFIKSEENTYNAMAPVFQNTNTIDVNDITDTSSVTGNVVGAAQNNTSETGENLLQDWLDYEVNEGETVPMIIQKDEDGNTVASAYWSAPFTKTSGELYIKYEGTTRANYTHVQPYNENKAPPRFKCGTVNTSETLMEAVYNVLATSLLAKLNPQFELSISVKDVQMLLGNDNMGYQLHESLQVKVPNFNYYVPCKITETVKNLHLPGENTIKIETEVTSITELINTEINSHDIIISGWESSNQVGGILLANKEPFSSQLINVTVRLVSSYATTDMVTQQNYATFDPYNNTYIFSKEQVMNLEKALRNDLIDTDYENNEYRLRDILGYVYSVPWEWCVAIYSAFIQLYFNNEDVTGTGYYEPTISVHYYNDAITSIPLMTNYEESKKYYASAFFEYYQIREDESETNNIGVTQLLGVNSYHDAEFSSSCRLLQMLTAMFYNFIADAPSIETYLGDLTWLAEKGFSYEVIPFTNEALYAKAVEKICLFYAIVDASLLANTPYRTTGRNKSVLLEPISGPGNNYYYYVYSYSPEIYDPRVATVPSMANTVISVPSLQNKGYFRWYNNNLWCSESPASDAVCIAISNTSANMADYEEVKQMLVDVKEFAPEIKTYKVYIDNVRTAIMEMIMTNVQTNNTNNMNTWTSITATDGTQYNNVSMYYLRAIAYAFMYYYRTHEEKSSNLSISIGQSEDSMKYYNHFDRTPANIGSYDWFSPCYPQNSHYRLGYICATLLFNLGIPYSPYDFTSNNTYDSFTDIADILKSKAGKTLGNNTLYTWITSCTKDNIKKYLTNQYYDEFNNTVILTYAKESALSDNAAITQTNYPVMIYGVNGNTVKYMNILANGNSPSNRYNTSIESSGTHNPYLSEDIDVFVNSVAAAANQVGGGDGGNMLIISWYTKAQLGG